jgi:hypothetical protein
VISMVCLRCSRPGLIRAAASTDCATTAAATAAVWWCLQLLAGLLADVDAAEVAAGAGAKRRTTQQLCQAGRDVGVLWLSIGLCLRVAARQIRGQFGMRGPGTQQQ